MRPEMCLICNDVRHYETTVNDVKNIIRRLERYKTKNTIPKDKEYYRLIQDLNFDKKHPHFMCGHCFKVNTNTLRIAEDNLNQLLTELTLSLTEKDNVYHEILQSLRGYYPGKYRVIERYVISKKL